jgi:hypothetical protein
MAGRPRASMADWLALHGLDRGACLRVLDSAPDPGAGQRRAKDPPYQGRPPWPAVLAAIVRALPLAAPVLARLAREVPVDLAPDPARFPRPFTLHDAGGGVPFVSCPLTGRLSDLLDLAHEAGHACQILAGGGAELPPVLRETAACLAERLVVQVIGPDHPEMPALLERRQARLVSRHAAALRTALDDRVSPYLYGWNYPLAAILARRAAATSAPDRLWAILQGQMPLPRLVAMFGS